MTLNLRLAILFLTACANLVLGLAVWRKNPDQSVNQRFAFLSVTVAAWALSNGLVNAYAGTPDGIVWARGAFFSAAILPIAFFFFVSVFPSTRPSPPGPLSAVFLAAGAAISILSTT